ncbi:asparagine synthase (glutamine-hydrolyzing) [Capillimicrobium parvum]|uniref:asparagine synthase (glutamine-hydrolyzing) n=1 Tax=Capillimicrobium parvum TaxID=2884022 RepID=A0A9E6Y2C9_9ACTN|nr:asparagine synthase (glutamine-hydrolyzing) [Capillimicrobium parvum]UGS38765.1 Asparagine synthetase [glutamine-hydrolyzing] 1 [Capillimicrobium parvum]
MCGIAGIVGGAPPDPRMLEAMALAVAHRGPDGQATWHDETCGLAFRRLAIIDLDDRSMQPMTLGPLTLVFNGEIYDYRERRDELRALGHEFRTEGDAEVLLHAWAQWGEGALDRLNGMFAFGLWDAARRALTLASDPFGEKPLLWARDGERLLFASDVRALLAARPELDAPDPRALAPFLALGAMPSGGDTFFAGVRRLPGAHLLRFRDGRVTQRRYWTPQPIDTPREPAAAAAHLRGLLLDAIALRLRADVPVGTSLSGGVDSSGIVALSAQLAGDHRRHAFTARFPGFERDEWSYAHETALAAGVVEHHAVEPTAADLLADLDALVCDQEEPAASTSVYAQWRVARAAREAGVTVMLDGQGADELFAGYPALIGWAARSQGPRAAARALRTPGEREWLVRALGAERLPEPLARRHRIGLATPYATADAKAAGAAATRPPDRGGRDPLRRELLREAFATRLPELLRYADRDSMAHAREVRLPFLDRRIAEFALSLPAQLLYRDGETKAVLRDALRGTVPDRVLDRREKVGFEPPQARWMADPALAAHARDVLLDAGARTAALVDRSALEADARAGTWRDPAGAWRALSLELWLRAFERVPEPVAAA